MGNCTVLVITTGKTNLGHSLLKGIMDAESKQVIRMLNTIAECNQEFIKIAQELRIKQETVRVEHKLECAMYGKDVLLEGYVDAELINGKGIAWYLTVLWDEQQWFIEASVLVNDEQGQDNANLFL